MEIEFRPLGGCPRGMLAGMLVESYRPLLDGLPQATALELRRQWDDFDREVHEAPDTVGRSGFVTLVGTRVAGFASWDPRGWPDVVRVGHNCVRPAFQRQGLGGRQIEEILARSRARGFAKAEARTGDEPFFEPARRMYVKHGFRQVGRLAGVLDPAHRTLVYELLLNADNP